MFGLSPTIVQDFYQVLRRFPQIERVVIFGSRAKNTARANSDIDLAVIGPTLTDQQFTTLWQAIDDLALVYKVDCLHWDRLANLGLKEKIIAEGRDFYVSGQ